MVALSYKPKFAPHVVSGRKPHSIRAQRKNPIRAGDQLQHYTGMRTKACKKLGDSRCELIYRINIIPARHKIILVGVVAANDRPAQKALPYCLGTLTYKENFNLAYADGFDTPEDFFAFFDHTESGVFEGHLIYWADSFKAVEA